MINIAICDDEVEICLKLESIIKNIMNDFKKKVEIDIFHTGEELYESLLKNNEYDIIFLDIEFKSMSGVEVGRRIRSEANNEYTKIIYISWKDLYAMDLFEVRPFNFLIKPLDENKIFEVLKEVMKIIEQDNRYFCFEIGSDTYKIKIKDILYFESNNRKIKIITIDETMVFYSKLCDVFSQVEKYDFFYIHKSFIVNYHHVDLFDYISVTMSNSKVLLISQPKRKEVRTLKICYQRSQLY